MTSMAEDYQFPQIGDEQIKLLGTAFECLRGIG